MNHPSIYARVCIGGMAFLPRGAHEGVHLKAYPQISFNNDTRSDEDGLRIVERKHSRFTALNDI
jgi:hypothetical protein